MSIIILKKIAYFLVTFTLIFFTDNYLAAAEAKQKDQEVLSDKKDNRIIPFIRERFVGDSALEQTFSALFWTYNSLLEAGLVMTGKGDGRYQKEAQEKSIQYVAPFLIADFSNSPWYFACYILLHNKYEYLVQTNHYIPILMSQDYTQILLKNLVCSPESRSDYFVSAEKKIQKMSESRILAFCPPMDKMNKIDKVETSVFIVLAKKKIDLLPMLGPYDRSSAARLELKVSDLSQAGHVNAIPGNPGIKYNKSTLDQKQNIFYTYDDIWWKYLSFPQQLIDTQLRSADQEESKSAENNQNLFVSPADLSAIPPVTLSFAPSAPSLSELMDN